MTMLSVRLRRRIRLDVKAGGEISANLDDWPFDLGIYPTAILDEARQLQIGLSWSALIDDDQRITNAEISRLIQALSSHGLLEYLLMNGDELLAVIEPQVVDYWPRIAALRNTDVLQLCRFSYLRQRDDHLILESPLSGALFIVCNSDLAASVVSFAQPHSVRELYRADKSGVIEFLALLLDSKILRSKKRGFKLQTSENDEDLALWDFHDLLFHTRSTEGRNATPVGATHRHEQSIAPSPAVRPPWPGKKIMLKRSSMMSSKPLAPSAQLLRRRHSTRAFNDQSPITSDELARFLESTARVVAKKIYNLESGPLGPLTTSTIRPYPSAGGSYELELYLTVDRCDGLEKGFYHYDAGSHALVSIKASEKDIEEILARSTFAMGATASPQILITIAARFSRVSWKYSSAAYALILKDVGVLTQTFYLMAAELGLGGCAIGISNIDLFAKMTDVEFYVEGPVGQFAMGRPANITDAQM